MSEQRHQVLVRTLCFVFNHKDEVLLIERASDKFDAGMYNVLGGHVEKGEDILESADREIFEESGIKPDSTKLAGFVHVTNFFGNNILMFVTKSTTSQVQLAESHEGILQWVKLSKIDKYNIYEDVRPFLERILSDKDKFIGTSTFDGKGGLVSLELRDLS